MTLNIYGESDGAAATLLAATFIHSRVVVALEPSPETVQSTLIIMPTTQSSGAGSFDETWILNIDGYH